MTPAVELDGHVEEGAALLLALTERRGRRQRGVGTVEDQADGGRAGLERDRRGRRDEALPLRLRSASPSTSRMQAIGTRRRRQVIALRHEDVAGELHLAEMLEQLLQHVEQHGALRLVVGDGFVRVAPHAARAVPRRRNRPGPRGAGGAPRGASDELRDRAGRRELGGAVPLDGASGHRGAAPVLHDAEAVGQDGVGRVGARKVRTAVGQLVAQFLDDGGHDVERQVGEPQVVGRATTGDPSASVGDPGIGVGHHRWTCAGNRPVITSVSDTFSSTERRLARTATQICWRCSAAPS